MLGEKINMKNDDNVGKRTVALLAETTLPKLEMQILFDLALELLELTGAIEAEVGLDKVGHVMIGCYASHRIFSIYHLDKKMEIFNQQALKVKREYKNSSHI